MNRYKDIKTMEQLEKEIKRLSRKSSNAATALKKDIDTALWFFSPARVFSNALDSLKNKIMRFFKVMVLLASAGLLCSCSQNKTQSEFKYSVDEFADIEVIKYKIPDWDSLSFQQKEYIYHLSEAAKYGRDIIWAQNFKNNLIYRRAIETVLENYDGDKASEAYKDFLIYAKRVFFSNGIHHHYSETKIVPGCTESYLASLFEASGVENAAMMAKELCDPEFAPYRRYPGTDKDIVLASACNLYEGVCQKEAEDFYAAMLDPNDESPVSYGLNSRLIKKDGRIVEDVYKVDGCYGAALTKIVEELEKACEVAENDAQKQYIAELVEYYRTGDLELWDKCNITWVQDTESKIDFINGFIEVYGDPLGYKGNWESNVNFRDDKASQRTITISNNAQWFEDHSPIDPRFRKEEVKGVSAKVINVACIAGDAFPSTAIGINLPNADWIRKDYGSKSVTIDNITEAYDKASNEKPNSVLAEFAYSQEEIDRAKKYGYIVDNLHTDLHECLGHGSGKLLPGTSPNALKDYSSTLEEARADLFALYYLADPKLVELGLLDSPDAYKAEYDAYIRAGGFTQFSRVALGQQVTEAHMQNRKLIADWCKERGAADNIIETVHRDGKTYFVINDYEALRGLFAELLAEIQRIKSEGDYLAGKKLVDNYGMNIDPDLHKEVIERYNALNLKPYRGFVNPDIVPVVKRGKTVDYKVVYVDDFLGQQLDYGKKYSTLFF